MKKIVHEDQKGFLTIHGKGVGGNIQLQPDVVKMVGKEKYLKLGIYNA